MNIIRAYLTLILEAEFGGLNVREFTVEADPHDNGFGVQEPNRLTIVTSADGQEFSTVIYSINGHDCIADLHGMNRDTWEVIWRKFRSLNKQL